MMAQTSFHNFNYQTEVDELDRRQKMAEMLQAQAYQPIDTFSYKGIAAPISPLSGLAKILSSYTAGKQQKDVLRDRKELEQTKKQNLINRRTEFAKLYLGRPGTSINEDEYMNRGGTPEIKADSTAAFKFALEQTDDSLLNSMIPTLMQEQQLKAKREATAEAIRRRAALQNNGTPEAQNETQKTLTLIPYGQPINGRMPEDFEDINEYAKELTKANNEIRNYNLDVEEYMLKGDEFGYLKRKDKAAANLAAYQYLRNTQDEQGLSEKEKQKLERLENLLFGKNTSTETQNLNADADVIAKLGLLGEMNAGDLTVSPDAVAPQTLDPEEARIAAERARVDREYAAFSPELQENLQGKNLPREIITFDRQNLEKEKKLLPTTIYGDRASANSNALLNAVNPRTQTPQQLEERAKLLQDEIRNFDVRYPKEKFSDNEREDISVRLYSNLDELQRVIRDPSILEFYDLPPEQESSLPANDGQRVQFADAGRTFDAGVPGIDFSGDQPVQFADAGSRGPNKAEREKAKRKQIAAETKAIKIEEDQRALDQGYATAILDAQAKSDIAQVKSAQKAIDSVEKLNRVISLTISGKPITGLLAETRKNIARIKALLGDTTADKKVVDTEILDAMLGSDVFEMISLLGIGARGLDTPAERDYLRSVMTGTIDLNENTLRKMTAIRRNIAKRAVERFNEVVTAGDLDDFFKSSKKAKKTLKIPEGIPYIENDEEYTALINAGYSGDFIDPDGNVRILEKVVYPRFFE
jgi:hypothetical protein